MWAIAGPLHDIDYEITDGDPSRYGWEGAELLLNHGVSPAIADAIQKHNAEGFGIERTTVFDHALACAETITGMIAATALVYPDKKNASVKPQSVTKRMQTPHFARPASHDIIMECETIGILPSGFCRHEPEGHGRHRREHRTINITQRHQLTLTSFFSHLTSMIGNQYARQTRPISD